MKKFFSLILAMVLVFGMVFTVAYADTFASEFNPGTMKEFDIKSSDTYKFTFTPKYSQSGEYTFISFGEQRPNVVVSYVEKQLIGSDKTQSSEIAHEDNMIFGTYTFEYGKAYTITVTSSDGNDATFSMIYFKADAEKCGFTSEPVKNTYYEDLEVSVSGSNVEFLHNSLDLTGAAFDLVDSDGNVIYTVKDNKLKNIVKYFTYSDGKITASVNKSYKILWKTISYSSITFEVLENPISEIRVNHDTLSYTYGEDGTIKGNLKNHYFIPDIRFDELTVDVKLKDGTEYKELPVSKKSDGSCFFSLEDKTDVYITNNAQCPDSGTVDADIDIGGTAYKLTVTIENAPFFKRIGIWFKLLFGIYNK